MSFLTRISFRNRKGRITIYGLVLLEVVAISFILPSSSSTGEITSICKAGLNPCPIFFDNIQTSGNAGTGLFLSTMNLLVNVTAANEIMVVSVGGNSNFNANTVTDTQLNSFSHTLTGVNALNGATLDVFTTFPSSGLDTLTVTFAGAVNDAVINVGFYKNVEGIGRVTTLSSTAPATSLSMPVNTTRSGSLILGFTELVPATNPGIVASTGFIQRTDQPSITGASEELDFEEANRTYTSSTTIPFNPSWPTLGANNAELGAIELTPNLHQGFDYSECLTVGDTCHVNGATKASGITNGNQLLHAGTTYCTGITTGALVTAVTSTLIITATYSLESRNVTGQVFTVLVEAGNTAPSTVFGSGVCAARVDSVDFAQNLYVPITSTTGTGFSTAFAISFTNQPAGTYYAWIDITPKTTNVAIDNLGGASTATVPGSSITLLEQK